MVAFLIRSFLLTTLLWGGGFLAFVVDLSLWSPPSSLPKTEAIVVLTGGSNRLEAGLALLKQDKADKLLLSGVNKSVRKKDLLLHEALPVDLGYQARSTIDNAYEAKAWLLAEKARSFYLVTAHYHMRRSLLEFHQRLQAYDIIPYPVRPREFAQKSARLNPALVVLVINEYNKYVLALCRAGIRLMASTFGLTT